MTDAYLDFEPRLASFGSDVYTGLRASQRRALEAYASNVDCADLAIELPAGYGKTLVALLIADYAMEQGRRVAATSCSATGTSRRSRG